jgi:tetraacyldisaccharide 4'-kinase
MSWGNAQTSVEKLCANLLTPATLIYRTLLNFHQLAYQEDWLHANKLSRPVISVGNLTVGGTGKTPIIIDLARQLLAKNIKVGILSRGYKRTNSQKITVVSDGQGNFASLVESGDEPLMMAQMLPQAIIIVGQDRFAAGQKAINDYGCQVLLLDDGFQHWRLQRDYNIVLLDYNDEPWHDNLLPAGRLREPLSALKRADHVVITKIPKIYHAEKIRRFKKLITQYAPTCAISLCQFEAVSLHQLIAGKWTDLSVDKLQNLPVIAFCGLAKAQGFFESVKLLGANVLQQISFSDHHSYSENDCQMLKQKLNELNAQYLITTRKDLVKLTEADISSRILAINLDTRWIEGAPDISGLVKISSVFNEVL